MSFDDKGIGLWRLAFKDLRVEDSETIALAAELVPFSGLVPFSQPEWSPLGRFVGYSVFDSKERARVEFIDTQDMSRRQVTDSEFGDVFVGWSPTRGFLTFARFNPPTWFLVLKFITQEENDLFLMGPTRWGWYAIGWNPSFFR